MIERESNLEVTTIDSFMESDGDYEIIELRCGSCGHEWRGSEMYEGACPNCGTPISKPGTGTALGQTCGKCKNHRHYPKCCEIHGKNHPDSPNRPTWGISAINCPDYENSEEASPDYEYSEGAEK